MGPGRAVLAGVMGTVSLRWSGCRREALGADEEVGPECESGRNGGGAMVAGRCPEEAWVHGEAMGHGATVMQDAKVEWET